MRRFRFVLSASLAVALVASLFVVPGSFAEPLGAGLLASFGVNSGQSENAGAQDDVFQFGLPVTVMNKDTQPVPVTVQGTSGDPLTATIDGTVSTEQVNLPGMEPFQHFMELTFDDGSTFATSDSGSNLFTVPAGKRLIIRSVSGVMGANTADLVQISITTTAGGTPSEHVIPPAYHAVFNASKDIYQYALETWVEADPGSDVVIFAGCWNDSGAFGGHISISGYLIDAPSP